MFRACRLRREHYGLSASNAYPVFTPHRRNGFFARRWRTFRQQTFLRKTVALCGYGAAGLGVYVALCASVHLLHQRTIAALFHPREDYLLDDWRDVEPTLKEGDILLMRGVGLLSWAIATAQLALGILHPAALRYSHVAVVVEPAVFELEEEEGEEDKDKEGRTSTAQAKHFTSIVGKAGYTADHAGYHNEYALPAAHDKSPGAHTAGTEHMRSPTASVQLNRSIHNAQQQQQKQQQQHKDSATSRTSHEKDRPRRVADLLREEASLMHKQHRMKRGAIILEAMDNMECHVPDIHGMKRYNAVQRVEATRRLCSHDAQGNRAYVHFSVRRLRHLDRSPALIQQIRQFCEDNEGRPMDASILYVLSFIHPRLYAFWRPERFAQREVSCSELIMELYQLIGLVRRRWRWVPLSAQEAAAYEAAQPKVQEQQTHNNSTVSGEARARDAGNGGPLAQPTTATAAAASLWPLPSPDDMTHGAGTMHVYENFYGRAELEAQHPLRTRPLPRVADYATIEDGEQMADPRLRTRSMQPLCAENRTTRAEGEEEEEEMMDAADIRGSDFNDSRPDGAAEDTFDFTKLMTRGRSRSSKAYAKDNAKHSVIPALPPDALPAPRLQAGDVARDRKGRLRQLRWYYKHYSLQTSPYQFTEGVDKTVIDWAPGCGLGQEIRMQIPNLAGPRASVDEDEGDDV